MLLEVVCYLSFWVSADIYDEARSKIEPLGMDTECVGGGRINHSSDKKNILVYGYSQVRNYDFEYCIYLLRPCADI